jgi:hypothetical protein
LHYFRTAFLKYYWRYKPEWLAKEINNRSEQRLTLIVCALPANATRLATGKLLSLLAMD